VHGGSEFHIEEGEPGAGREGSKRNLEC